MKYLIIGIVALNFSCTMKSKNSAAHNSDQASTEIQKNLSLRKACTDAFVASEYGQLVLNSESYPSLNQISRLSEIPQGCSTDHAIRANRMWQKIYRQQNLATYLKPETSTLAEDLKFIRNYLETNKFSNGEYLIHLVGLNRIAKALEDQRKDRKKFKKIQPIAKELLQTSEYLEREYLKIFVRSTDSDLEAMKLEIATVQPQDLLGAPDQQEKLTEDEVKKIKNIDKTAELNIMENWQKQFIENQACLNSGDCYPCGGTIIREACVGATQAAEEEKLKSYLFAELILPKYADGFQKIKISTQRLVSTAKKLK